VIRIRPRRIKPSAAATRTADKFVAGALNVQLHGFGSLILSAVGPTFSGKTIDDVLAAANTAIGGGALPAGFTYSSLNNLVDLLNNALDGCRPTGWVAAHLH